MQNRWRGSILKHDMTAVRVQRSMSSLLGHAAIAVDRHCAEPELRDAQPVGRSSQYIRFSVLKTALAIALPPTLQVVLTLIERARGASIVGLSTLGQEEESSITIAC